VCLGVLLIGVGGSFVKPCIAGTVQKTSGLRKTLGFAIFYMVINIGSLIGRFVSFGVRRRPDFNLSSIFFVSLAAAAAAFFLVLFLYRDPDRDIGRDMGAAEKKPQRPIGEVLAGIPKVLANLRFAMFLVVSSGFFLIYNQVYNLLPLYTKTTVELTPAMDLYTAANPFVIVTCQLLITRVFGRLPPIKSIFIGIVIISASMLVNIVPLYMSGGVTRVVGSMVPLGSLFVVMTVAMIAFGELFNSSRLYEYIGSLSPKGQEGLFQGYANLPMAIGSIIGGPAGAWIFNEVMCGGARRLPGGLLALDPGRAALGWAILAGCGLASAVSMYAYHLWIKRQTEAV
jgi:dipeptide/tripeptide permease